MAAPLCYVCNTTYHVRRRSPRSPRYPGNAKAPVEIHSSPGAFLCRSAPECRSLHVLIENRDRVLGHSLAAISIAIEQRRKVDATIIRKPPHFIRTHFKTRCHCVICHAKHLTYFVRTLRQ